jgi:hypothetical protein
VRVVVAAKRSSPDPRERRPESECAESFADRAVLDVAAGVAGGALQPVGAVGGAGETTQRAHAFLAAVRYALTASRNSADNVRSCDFANCSSSAWSPTLILNVTIRGSGVVVVLTPESYHVRQNLVKGYRRISIATV